MMQPKTVPSFERRTHYGGQVHGVAGVQVALSRSTSPRRHGLYNATIPRSREPPLSWRTVEYSALAETRCQPHQPRQCERASVFAVTLVSPNHYSRKDSPLHTRRSYWSSRSRRRARPMSPRQQILQCHQDLRGTTARAGVATAKATLLAARVSRRTRALPPPTHRSHSSCMENAKRRRR